MTLHKNLTYKVLETFLLSLLQIKLNSKNRIKKSKLKLMKKVNYKRRKINFNKENNIFKIVQCTVYRI